MMNLMALVLTLAEPAAAGQIGIQTAALATVRSDPATYDLAGIRLGMSEADLERVVRDRGMTVQSRTRVKSFEDRVRDAANTRGGHLRPQGGSVLGRASLDDGRGGRVMIEMLGWPDGARVRAVTYIAPAGTDAAAWRNLLVGKYGPPSRDSGSVDAEGLHARWCGRQTCLGEGRVFRLVADVGERGGTIFLSQPEGTADKVTALVEQAAMRRGVFGTPSP